MSTITLERPKEDIDIKDEDFAPGLLADLQMQFPSNLWIIKFEFPGGVDKYGCVPFNAFNHLGLTCFSNGKTAEEYAKTFLSGVSERAEETKTQPETFDGARDLARLIRTRGTNIMALLFLDDPEKPIIHWLDSDGEDIGK